ncbi:deoxyribodipyrimidine photo-lyase [uncultured Rhodoferax sp.]|uniref:cryptochrome/photolyase family protein n=1 Tax=uncultured Rhodoferax sp. TaxID=223188 RepID=UPI0025D7753F|nr:deoxyribodipyrimidine photo-lyase [uncultured Rhodoferax sp.]
MQTPYASGLVWFRRDLRTHDNTALCAALQQCTQVHCVFVFDTDILAPLPRQDRRVEFIRESLVALDAQLRSLSGRNGAGLIVLHGAAAEEIPRLAQALDVQAVFAGKDYEPQTRTRDASVQQRLQRQGQTLHLLKDHVVFEEREVLTQAGNPYGVFTPYLRAWLARLMQAPTQEQVPSHTERLAERPDQYARAVPALADIGFESTNLQALRIPTGEAGAQSLLGDFLARMDRYADTRDYPAIKGPSYLSVHLRFGTVSIRQLVLLAHARQLAGDAGAGTWLSELVWREFYVQILANFPHVADAAFKPEYDQIVWEEGPHAEALYQAWCQGKTGYPIVDAAMAQLNQTGYMHNRLRMVVGSFLVKHLGLDWRWGERYFAQTLNDFDLAANNGGWQWVSSSGCDAQPYFRIFNPINQSEKFDAEGKFIRRYLPQLTGLGAKAIHAPWLAKPLELSAAGVALGQDYPHPIVDHAQARSRTLLRYGVVKKPV